MATVSRAGAQPLLAVGTLLRADIPAEVAGAAVAPATLAAAAGREADAVAEQKLLARNTFATHLMGRSGRAL